MMTKWSIFAILMPHFIRISFDETDNRICFGYGFDVWTIIRNILAHWWTTFLENKIVKYASRVLSESNVKNDPSDSNRLSTLD